MYVEPSSSSGGSSEYAIPPEDLCYHEEPEEEEEIDAAALEAERQAIHKRLMSRRMSQISFPEIDIEGVLEGADEVLGSGAFGSVMRSTWRGADVAVKVIQCSDITEEEINDFRREVKMVALLGNHPNVVKLVGACTKPPRLAMVMQLCERGSVYDYVVRKKLPLTPLQCVSIARDTAAGLLHLFSEGVVHRDIAARNVLLDRNLRAYVNDFGLSRAKDLAQAVSRTKQLIGPIKWMAPESLLAPGTYSFETDVWGFGVFLFELNAHTDPYPSLTPTEAMLAVIQQKSSLTLPDDCPPFWQELINKCTQFDPALRPSIGQLYRILNSHYRQLDHY